MKGLHALTAGQSAFFWGHARNMRHNLLPDADGRRVGHVWEVMRGNPPMIGSPYRRLWAPYINDQRDRNFVINPLCGRLVTTSRAPYFSVDNWGGTRCPNCTRIARERHITIADWNSTVQADPWVSIPWGDRNFTPDPLTGL